MLASLKQIMVEPFKEYAIIVEVRSRSKYQIYRVGWSCSDGQSLFAENDHGDPRRTLGRALQDLGRSLEISHGHPLIDHRTEPPF